MEGTIGEIRMFAGSFAPRTWWYCDGSLIAIRSNTALFSILGTVYGGDGQTTFGLPDLRGRVAVGQGSSRSGAGNMDLGQTDGSETVTLNITEIPAHIHAVTSTLALAITEHAVENSGTSTSPVNNFPGTQTNAYGAAADTLMAPSPVSLTVTPTIQPNGGSQPHENRQPFLAMNYIICMQGVFPARD